jgi:hypothetical protein
VHTQQYLGESRAVRLASGKALFIGNNGTAELYDPTTNESVTRPMLARRGYSTATLLNSGKVLVTGGVDFSTSVPEVLATAELYDPALDRFVAIPTPMSTPASSIGRAADGWPGADHRRRATCATT